MEKSSANNMWIIEVSRSKCYGYRLIEGVKNISV